MFATDSQIIIFYTPLFPSRHSTSPTHRGDSALKLVGSPAPRPVGAGCAGRVGFPLVKGVKGMLLIFSTFAEMKTTLTFESVTEDKLKLLIRVAVEMGIKLEDEPAHVSEPRASYNRNEPVKKTAFLIEASSAQKLDLFLKVAGEMGILLFPFSLEQAEDMLLAENSLKEEWLAPENDHWDEFLKTHKIA